MDESLTRRVTVLDHRRKKKKNTPDKYNFKLETDNLCDFVSKLIEKTGGQDFVLTFPNRTPVDANNYKEVTNNSTLWLLNDFDQK